MGIGDVKLRCSKCGHIMNAKKANSLDEMKPTSYWKCTVCRQTSKVKIEIKKWNRKIKWIKG